MKFGKLLKDNLDGLPGGGIVLDYKRLKKQLKALHSITEESQQAGQEAPEGVVPASATQARSGNAPQADAGGAQPAAAPVASPPPGAEAETRSQAAKRAFVEALNKNMQQINDYFIEKEEDSVIRIKCLEDELDKAESTGSSTVVVQDLQHRFADLHGDLVMLLHWSLLNYAALAKILKKHDKLTGSDLKDPFLATALQQPFSSTSVLSSLLWQAEQQLTKLQGMVAAQRSSEASAGASSAPAAGSSRDGGAAPGGEGAGQQWSEALALEAARYAAKTSAALNVWQQMRDTAKTPSTYLAAGLVLPARRAPAATDSPLAKRRRKST